MDPFRVFSNPFVALCRSSWSFVDIFLSFRGNLFPLSDLWRIPLEPSPTPSWPFAVLRGPSWISFCLFVEIFSPLPTFGGSLSSLLQPLRGPLPFFVVLRGYLFVFSWKSFLPSQPLADPSRAFSNPFVALCRSSWPFVDIFLPFRGNLFSLPILWRIPLELSPTPSWPFVVLRGFLFLAFVDNPQLFQIR